MEQEHLIKIQADININPFIICEHACERNEFFKYYTDLRNGYNNCKIYSLTLYI
jgi:hypothetical protein